MLYWQVTHQAAVKSTNTGAPLASSCSTRPGAHGCQRSVAEAVLVVSAIFKTFWPIAPVNIALIAIEIVAIDQRARPVSVSDQITKLKATSSASSALAPSMPVCCPSTHTSQTTVANIGNAMARRNVFIQAPGRGSSLATAGIRLAAR